MIFKQVDEIITRRKTQTRRIVKPGEHGGVERIDLHPHWQDETVEFTNHPFSEVYTPAGKLKWCVGRTYAVQFKRGQHGVEAVENHSPPIWREMRPDRPRMILPFRPVRIRLTSIRRESLPMLTVEDAVAEGYPYSWPSLPASLLPKIPPDPLTWYRQLWDTINTRKGTRWQDNPDVWVLTFELVG